METKGNFRILDVIIVGGGVAGLSAALYLGRFKRNVVVFDTQRPANRFSHAAHSFFTRDGIAPSELNAIGREQLRQYESVQIQTGDVRQIVPETSQFSVMLADGDVHRARKILLATGLRDELPPIAGIEAFWGRSVFHCPYCDGWEKRDQPLAIIADGESGLHVAKLLRVLTDDLVLCTNGSTALNSEQQALLGAHDIELIETGIDRLEGIDGQVERIVFADGRQLARSGIFVRTKVSQHSALAGMLGCTLTAEGLVQVDTSSATSVPGIYAAGDMANPFRQLIGASMQGATAAVSINIALIAEDFR